MCMCDDYDELVTMLSASDPKARKDHKCSECLRVISAGETYHSERYIFDEKLTIHKTCAHCMVARGWLNAECGGWLYGEIREDLLEHVESGGYGMELARLAVAMQNKWARKDGALRPVPSMPKNTPA